LGGNEVKRATHEQDVIVQWRYGGSETWTDAYVAELAEEWLAGATQKDLTMARGFARNTAVSLRLRRFVGKYLPGRSFRAHNAIGNDRISADASRIDVWVIPTDEERMIAGTRGRCWGFRVTGDCTGCPVSP
jgi:hypothetical protein